MVKEQIIRVLDDLYVTHIKIGMLGSDSVVESICDALADYTGEIIFDPVLISTSGQKLIDPKGYYIIRKQLLPLCTVITPNVPELSILTEEKCSTKKALQNAAENLLQEHGKLRSIIITGGHFKPEEDIITDFMLRSTGKNHSAVWDHISHPRITSNNTHGTGCTFSAAFTAYLLLTGDDTESFKKSTQYMENIIKSSATVKIGLGTGPLMHHLK